MTGPKTAATAPVPKRWTANSANRMTMVIGTMYGSKAGVTVFSPSTADRTEIAGVMIASPTNSAAPTTPRMRMSAGWVAKPLRASDISDSVPPSPSSSARSTKPTYFTVTISVSAQTISDRTPRTSSRTTVPSEAATLQRLAEGVDRAGADIAVDDAERTEDQDGKRAAMRLMRRR